MSEADLVEQLWTALLAMGRLTWEQGVASQAAIDRGSERLALAIARDAVAHADSDGRLAATGDSGLVNGGSLGEAVALLARSGDTAAHDALDRQRWWFLRWSPRDDEGVVWHLAGRSEVWVDSIYMVVPFLVLTGDIAPADMQYRMHREHLWNESTGLYSHRADTLSGLKTRPELWASGNGWAAAGMARALRLGSDGIPTPLRERWQHDTRALLDAMSAYENADGRFHDVLDDPHRFTCGTASLMAAYAAATGVADGWLEDSYALRARRWLDAALANVDDFGVVQGVCGAPHFDRAGTSAEAQAFALMALTAVEALPTAVQ